MTLTDTIVAISTALDEAAISIVRMSGSEAIDIANKVFSKDLKRAKTFSAHYGWYPQSTDKPSMFFPRPIPVRTSSKSIAESANIY